MSCMSKTSTAVLLCIHCSGGIRDANGAHTVCALCELGSLAAEAA